MRRFKGALRTLYSGYSDAVTPPPMLFAFIAAFVFGRFLIALAVAWWASALNSVVDPQRQRVDWIEQEFNRQSRGIGRMEHVVQVEIAGSRPDVKEILATLGKYASPEACPA